MTAYMHPEVLVSTEWVESHRRDAAVRLAEVDVDAKSYAEGHIPGAVAWAWGSQLCDTLRRDILSQDDFAALMSASGVSNDTTVVLYGDNNNWFAAWALWQMKIYGHADVRLMNGGRKKWLAEGKELAHDIPCFAPAGYQEHAPDLSIWAFLDEVQRDASNGRCALVDVRSPQEFTGEILAPTRTAGNMPARGPHTRRAQYPMGQGLQRRRHVQDHGRVKEPVWRGRRGWFQ